MKTRPLFPRLLIAGIIFGALMMFLIITPILVAAKSEPLDQVSTGTATSYAYLPIVFGSAVETGMAVLNEHSDTIVAVSVYGFMGFGLLLGVVGLFMPSARKDSWIDEAQDPADVD